MAAYIDLCSGNYTNEEGFHKAWNQMFSGGFPLHFNANAFKPVQRASGANMSVDLQPGGVNLARPDGSHSVWGWCDSNLNCTITAADVSNPRVDVVVVWYDPTAVTGATNGLGALKTQAFAGTPSGSPSAVTDTAIQTALGSTIAWQKVAYVFVGTSVTSITSGVITDARNAMTALAPIGSGAISPSQLNTTNWTPSSYTPTVTAGSGSFTTTSAIGRYLKIGKLLWLHVEATITTVGSGTVSVNVSLPSGFTGKTGSIQIINGREDGTSGKQVEGKITSGGSTVAFFNYDNTAPIGANAVVRATGFIEVN